MTAGAPPSLTIWTSPKPACVNSFATASALRSTSCLRAGAAPTDSMRTRASKSRRTEGSTSRTRSTRSLMLTTLTAHSSTASVRSCTKYCGVSRADTHGRGRNLALLEDGDRGGGVPLMRQRQMDRHLLQVLGDRTGQPNPRPTPHVGHHLDIAVDALRQHRSLREARDRPRLDHCLLGLPPGRQVARRRRTLVRGVAALTGRERLREHRSRLVDLLRELGDRDKVDADANDAHPRNTSSRYLLFVQALTACTRRFRRAWTQGRATSRPLPDSPAPRRPTGGCSQAAHTTVCRRRSPRPASAARRRSARSPAPDRPVAVRDRAPR